MHLLRCCHCQTPVFFENDACIQCGALLGFVPGLLQMRAYDPDSAQPLESPAAPAESSEANAAGAATNTATIRTADASANPPPWQPMAGDAGPALRPCANRLLHGNCNWMLDEGDAQSLCISCRLTRVLPPLSEGRNLARWTVFERAKRRLVFGLLALGLRPEPKTGPDDEQGLAFELLEDQPGAPPVKTGHDRGVITLNVAEADDDQRERLRVRLGEPVRTPLGHLRHEVSHYLQYRWIDDTPQAEECRAVFGDERADYAAALARHYAEGPPVDWPQNFVSAYASAHPWEDWAETCAHYLLVLDAVQTASAWGLQLQGPSPTAPALLQVSKAAEVDELVLQQWLPVAQFLNAMNRSLGQRDSYPFLLPPKVLQKMGTVQRLLQEVTRRQVSAPTEPEGQAVQAASAASAVPAAPATAA